MVGRSAYPDKVTVGAAAHRFGSDVRFILSATAAAAGLYTAVITFGPGPSPSPALGRDGDRGPAIVRVPHDRVVPVAASMRPQASTRRVRLLGTKPLICQDAS